MADPIVVSGAHHRAPTTPSASRPASWRPEPGRGRRPHRRHRRARHRQRRPQASARASTSSRSPSTSRSACTPPGASPARSSAVRAGPPTRPSSPAGSSTARCGRASPTASATRPRSSSPSSAPTSRTRTTSLAINAASAALMLSGIPFDGPIGAVRIACTADGEWIPHPTYEEGDDVDLRAGRRRPPARRRRRRHHDGRGRRHRGRLGASTRTAPRR